ncbi:MAG: hypothetical protein K2P81_12050 [Bacteriovoracaceae bacterium]|nr:hypothetical protein [Bacteriovoracaceae bacterium]
MFLNFLMKKPIFAIGLLMFIAVWLQSKGRFPLMRDEKLNPTVCRAALVKLEKESPASWKLSCNDNNLEVIIDETQLKAQPQELQAALYRQLANHMVELAKRSQNDILEKVFIVHVKLEHSKMEINAISEGKYVAKLATLNSPQAIMDHLKQTVQVKDTVK